MMTAMKPVLELVFNANVVFFVAFGLWAMTHAILRRSRWRNEFGLQLRLLRAVLLCVIVSPFLALAGGAIGHTLWASTPVTISDVVIAAYLRGDIAIPAVEFEQMLNARSRVFDAILAGNYPGLTALTCLLALGCLALLSQAAYNVLRVNQLVRESYVWRKTPNVDIRLSDTVSVPFAVRGVLRRHVVLPSNLILQPNELRIVLAHEFEHLRQGDVEWEVVFEILRPFLYWNPAFLLWKRAFAVLRETSCDRAVLDTLKISPRDYADCLLQFCGQINRGHGAERFNVGLVRTRNKRAKQALEGRLMALHVKQEHQRTTAVFWMSTSVLAAGIFLAAVSVQEPSDWTHDRLMLSTIVNLERMEAYGF